jgi:hypothetical protein
MSSILVPYHIYQNINDKIYEVEKFYKKLDINVTESIIKVNDTSKILKLKKIQLNDLIKNIEKINKEIVNVKSQIETQNILLQNTYKKIINDRKRKQIAEQSIQNFLS